MKAVRGAAAVAVLAVAVAGCGSTGPSHADRIACRAVWREFQLAKAAQAGGGELPVFAPDAAAAALAGSAAGASQPLSRDLTTVSDRLLLVNTPAPAQLAPVTRDCKSLGITESNAEDVG